MQENAPKEEEAAAGRQAGRQPLLPVWFHARGGQDRERGVAMLSDASSKVELFVDQFVLGEAVPRKLWNLDAGPFRPPLVPMMMLVIAARALTLIALPPVIGGAPNPQATSLSRWAKRADDVRARAATVLLVLVLVLVLALQGSTSGWWSGRWCKVIGRSTAKDAWADVLL